MITLEQALARADPMTGCTETQEVVKVLAAEVRRLQKVDPDEWEFETVEGPRKGDNPGPPDGEGWERDYSSGRPAQAWDRFDSHEEYYWKRRKPKEQQP